MLVALYENGTPFEPLLVDLGNEAARTAFYKVWPVGKLPVLADDARGQTIPKSTIGHRVSERVLSRQVKLIPPGGDRAWQTRFHDRFFDWHVHDHMQKIVGNKLRPADAKDPVGTSQARAKLQTSYWILNERARRQDVGDGRRLHAGGLRSRAGAVLRRARRALRRRSTRIVASYLARLKQRPSFARVIEEAQPFFQYFPGGG